jgi:hypothetical protein
MESNYKSELGRPANRRTFVTQVIALFGAMLGLGRTAKADGCTVSWVVPYFCCCLCQYPSGECSPSFCWSCQASQSGNWISCCECSSTFEGDCQGMTQADCATATSYIVC